MAGKDLPRIKCTGNPTSNGDAIPHLTIQQFDSMLCVALAPVEAFAVILLKLSDQNNTNDVNAGSIGEVLAALQSNAYNTALEAYRAHLAGR